MAAGQREGARQRVQREMFERGWNVADLAREAGVDPGTVGDFINGPRWPQASTQSKLSRALGWTADGLDRLSVGLEPISADEIVVPASQNEGVLLKLSPEAFEGLDPLDRARAEAEATAAWLRVAQEARRRADER